jgi:hypothetical protein
MFIPKELIPIDKYIINLLAFVQYLPSMSPRVLKFFYDILNFVFGSVNNCF